MDEKNNKKIIELKRKINNDDFRMKEIEARAQYNRNKLSAPKKKKRKLNLINIVFAVFVIYFAYTGFNQNQMIKALDVQIADRSSVKEQAQKKAETLKKDVDKISNDEVAMLDLVEKIARNQYKMVKPNETLYIDKNKTDNKFISGIGFGDDIVNDKADSDDKADDSKDEASGE